MAVMNVNPYESSQIAAQTTSRRSGMVANLGTTILLVGLAALAYGAFTFWIMPLLSPNTAWSGRLPSLYCMGAGIFTALIGLTLRSLQPSPTKKATVPTSVGILVIVAIVIAFFVAVSRL